MEMSMLGKGAYSFVETYEVNGVTYARKVLRLRPEAASKEYGIPSVFVREVAVLKRLSHPNIVSLIDVELDVEVKIYNIILPLAHERYVEVVTVLDHPASDKAPFGQAVRARSEAGGGWMGWCVAVDDLDRDGIQPAGDRDALVF